ncbi:MAG: Ppx/GppA family phosphatase [Proteobacteria bacterium]|nr:Ppx/GppA family phosphatase [Pseudomonadota bacterium]MDE3207321.1 Ppx/GppA family phosphatase [Pseudomonadota bacterium]
MEFEQLAAVDLGSNSFRLQIARVVDDIFYPLDSYRETVRLAAGLTVDRMLDSASRQRALVALSRFGERLRGFPRDAVRAVGTNALRAAKNAREFILEAQSVLGYPIEVIAGREEARLIYQGVTQLLSASSARRLVIDIGGGSTEFIIGNGTRPHLMESLYMGCVSYSMRFFPDGVLTEQRFLDAKIAALAELESITAIYRQTGWDEVYGSSGTARAISSILELNGITRGSLTLSALCKLRQMFIEAGHVANIALAGLKTDRLMVLPGGFVIMDAIIEAFGIEQLFFAEGALREGVLFDLAGRHHHADMREQTVRQMMRRYHVDHQQARRVAQLAVALYTGHLPPMDDESTLCRKQLEWAGLLHEVGIDIAHSGYHKHSAYIVEKADMPGFSRIEQILMAQIILAHRGRLTKVREGLSSKTDRLMAVCLRFAALICRNRTGSLPMCCSLEEESGVLVLKLDSTWLEAHPLTLATLDQELNEWKEAGWFFRVRRV